MGDVLNSFRRIGAVYEDEHFVQKSGRHSSTYYHTDVLLSHISNMWLVTRELAADLSQLVDCKDVVVMGPEYGGNYMAQMVATQLWDITGQRVFWVGTQKKEPGHVEHFPFRLEPGRGFSKILEGKRAIIVEDVMSTGYSAKGVVNLALWHHAKVAAVAAALVTGDVTVRDLGVGLMIAGERVETESYYADNCRLCQQERPMVTDLGHGDQFEAGHPDYAGGFKKLLT